MPVEALNFTTTRQGKIMTRPNRNAAAAITLAVVISSQPSLAADGPSKLGDPVPVANGITFDPILDARLRWEDVNQPTTTLKTADAVTVRVRAGFELKDVPSHLSFLAEAEGTLAIDGKFNAFPYALTNSQRQPQYATVADPNNIALNRLQIQYRTKALGLTLGRQRINLDDERWVGSSGWRQNEQTFNAVRGEAELGPLSVDTTYSNRQNTIYGDEGGPRVGYNGRFWFLTGGIKTGPVTTKGFAYLLDYDPTSFGFQGNSSQTYGFRSTGSFMILPKLKVNLAGSFARQSSYADNPTRYAASYGAAEAGLDIANLTVKGGYELLGGDTHAVSATGAFTTFAMQTPMATLHKFNGWADLFLATPAKGLQDTYAAAAYRFTEVKAIPGLNAQIIYHKFGSDIGSLRYGHETDGAIGFKTGPVGWLVKYADYVARGFGVDTKKFWLQAEFKL